MGITQAIPEGTVYMLVHNYHQFRQKLMPEKKEKVRKLSQYVRCVGTGQGRSREPHGDSSCFEVSTMDSQAKTPL